MKKVSSKKGFTLAELLIVVAIIAVLVATSIPVFGAQLNKARAAADVANVRAAYAEAVSNAMADNAYNAAGKLPVTINEAVATNGSAVTFTAGNTATDPGTLKINPTYDGIADTDLSIDADVVITVTARPGNP